MRISKKTRYAVRALIELARQYTKKKKPVRLEDVAREQDIPQRYLENIFNTLVKTGILKGIKGKSGGFTIPKPYAKIRMDEVVNILEAPLESFDCLHSSADCVRGRDCSARKLWTGLSGHLNRFFSRITLQDLVNDTASAKI